MLPGLKCLYDQFCVGVVAGENGDGIDVRVANYLIIIGRCVSKTKLFPGMPGMESA